MYSPSRKVRASVRRTLCLLLIGFGSGLLLVQTLIEVGRTSADNQYTPTRSVGLMLNRSQMILAKEILLEPTVYTCQSNKSSNCSHLYPLYIIVKTQAVSSGEYFQRRMFTRTSWAQEAQSLGIPVIYAVGRAKDDQIQTKLEDEHRIYGDILQFNYIDSYYNITIKSTGLLNWFVKRGCQRMTPYLFIVDDDVLINIPSIMRMISNQTFHSNTLYGLYLADIEPHPSGKWAVSLTDYPNRTYPSFITGPSTLYPSQIVNRVVEKIFQFIDEDRPIFFLEDVFITGIIAEQIGIQRAPMFGIEDCSYTDLFVRTIINDCSNVRRTYVWSKFILSRIGQHTYEIDRLISRTIYHKWQGNFKYMRNGTAIIQSNRFNQSMLVILSNYHPKISFLVLFILLFLLISILIPKLINSRQSITSSKLPLTSSRLIENNSLRLLAPIKQ